MTFGGSFIDSHLSPDTMFSTTLPGLKGGERSAFTQPHCLFLHNHSSKCLSSLRFCTIQRGSGSMSKIIHVWMIHLPGVILSFRESYLPYSSVSCVLRAKGTSSKYCQWPVLDGEIYECLCRSCKIERENQTTLDNLLFILSLDRHFLLQR